MGRFVLLTCHTKEFESKSEVKVSKIIYCKVKVHSDS